MQDKKVRLTIEVTREMLLDLMLLTSDRCSKVLNVADKHKEEGCNFVAEKYIEYADMLSELNIELSEVYEREFEDED